MAGSKDHTKISTTNIIKLAMEALPTADQRPFEDLVMRNEKEVMLGWNEQRDKEEAELLHKLSERRKEVAEKYLSHFTVDRHQKIIRQGEIDMESLLPPLQGPAVSAPDLSLTTFMDQRGDQLKQYVDESIKMHLHSYEKSTAPSFLSRETNTEPPAPKHIGYKWVTLGPAIIWYVDARFCVTITATTTRHAASSGRSRTVRASSQTVRLYRGPSGVFRRTVRPDAGLHTDRSGHTVYGRIIRVQPWTIWPHHGPSGTLCRTIWIWHEPASVLRRTVQVAPYMTEPSRYNLGSFGRITDRPALYDERSGYGTTQVAPYTAGQSRYTFGQFGPVADHPTPYAGPSEHAYAELRVA
jgi:hypothetical protein